MKKMMMKERHSYIIRTALMAASGILLCGIAEAVRPEVDLSVDVPADKVVIADGILDQETQNDTDESFCDRLMKKMVHPIHMASRFLNGLGADSEEYVPSETEYNLMALRTEESAVDLSDPLAAFESLPWYKLAKRFRSMGTEVCTRESADTGRNCILPGFTSRGFITGAACRYHMRAQFRWQDSILLWRKTEYSRTFRQSFCQRDKPGLQGTDFVRA